MSKVKISKDDMIAFIEGCVYEMQEFIKEYRANDKYGEDYDEGDFAMDMEAQCTQIIAKVFDVDWTNLDWNRGDF